MIQNALPIILTIIFLAGCTTLAPEYRRPTPPIPSEWPKGPAYKDIGVTPEVPAASEITWQDLFTDERLKKVIDMSLNNNRDLRVAALNIDKARALYRIQRAELFPTVDAMGIGSKQRLPADVSGTGHSMTVEQYSVNLGISSWELDFFGRIRSLKDRALEQYFATEQARRSAQISLMAEVANLYMTLAADRESLKLAQDTLESQETTYKLIRRRYEIGISSELDLRQAQTRVEAARVDVAKYTRQVAMDENALNLLVGSPVTAELLPEGLSEVTPPKDVSPGISSEVLLRRPDILQAEKQLKAANANIGAARAALFPRISLTSIIGTISDELSGLFKSGSGTWTFASQIIQPIFDTRLRWGLKAVKADHEIALAQYEKTIQAGFREVADALAQRGTVGDQIAAQESLVQASAEAYRLSNIRYIKGIDSYLRVLDAQRSLYAAEQGLIALRLARLTNLVTLYKVLGGGNRTNGP